MNADEGRIYQAAQRSIEAKTDSQVLREMAAQSAVRQYQVDALMVRVAKLEGEMTFFKQLVQRGRGAAWVIAAIFGLGLAVVYSREKIAEALAFVSQSLGGQK